MCASTTLYIKNLEAGQGGQHELRGLCGGRRQKRCPGAEERVAFWGPFYKLEEGQGHAAEDGELLYEPGYV